MEKKANSGHLPSFSKPLTLKEQIDVLDPLNGALQKLKNPLEKLKFINKLSWINQVIKNSKVLTQYLAHLNPLGEYALKSLIVSGQGPLVFQKIDQMESPIESLGELIKTLLEVEASYASIGGILGYHLAVLKLIEEKETGAAKLKLPQRQYLHPEGIDISQEGPHVHQAIRWGIEALPEMAEIYPVGGAGDRLNLIDEETGQPLPVAQLNLGGKTLLEGLIRDLQAREFLYYKLTGKQVITPIALMTSHEKDNHSNIIRICESLNWFNRPKDTFFFFTQPLVPVITKEGNWSLYAPLKLNLKPGGHGIMWKLAIDAQIFDRFRSLKRRKVLVRQINNPVAGVDHGLLSFAGLGHKGDKTFGFASCPRRLKSPEGVDVLIETETAQGFAYTLTNIEYTEFEQKGIEDRALNEKSPYSAFPSNTNILFADLQKVHEVAIQHPLPGMLINMKTTAHSLNHLGECQPVEAGRLETTMQNIADYITDYYPRRLKKDEFSQLQSFITFNERRKTISVTKASFLPGKEMHGTPVGCFYEIHQNHEELLSKYCRMAIPPLGTEHKYLEKGPAFLFFYHPALGPLYSVIGQKIRGGKMHEGAELQLEISEVELENLNLEGSLLINATNSLGLSGQAYSHQGGKCTLKNVQVQNKGIKRDAANVYWKNQIEREESLHIILHGNGEFYAEGVVFKGAKTFEVPAGHVMTISPKLEVTLTPLKQANWYWEYQFTEEDRVQLKKKFNG